MEAMEVKRADKVTYEVRQIDAWGDEVEGLWCYNETWHIGSFDTCAKNEKRAFMRFLKKNGITFKLNRTLIIQDWNVMEVIDRKTKEPLFCAVYKEVDWQ